MSVRPATIVVNKRTERFQVYIGRPSRWGNAHPIGWCNICRCRHDRAQAIEMFTHDALNDEEFCHDVRRLLRGKVLGCFCKPLPCHGDILVAIAEGLL